jgi:hypothetical protein
MITRAPRPKGNFYILNKEISEDRRLTWAARGLLVFLLGKPDHWKVSVPALTQETASASKQLKRDGLWGLLRELEATGYCRRTQTRFPNGKMSGMDYAIGEGQPLTPSSVPAEPCTANPTLVSIDGEVRIDVAASIEKKKESAGAKSKITFDKKSGEFCNITAEQHAFWSNVGSASDIDEEIARAACWLIATPLPMMSRYDKFLDEWMSKAARERAANCVNRDVQTATIGCSLLDCTDDPFSPLVQHRYSTETERHE